MTRQRDKLLEELEELQRQLDAAQVQLAVDRSTLGAGDHNDGILRAELRQEQKAHLKTGAELDEALRATTKLRAELSESRKNLVVIATGAATVANYRPQGIPPKDKLTETDPLKSPQDALPGAVIPLDVNGGVTKREDSLPRALKAPKCYPKSVSSVVTTTI